MIQLPLMQCWYQMFGVLMSAYLCSTYLCDPFWSILQLCLVHAARFCMLLGCSQKHAAESTFFDQKTSEFCTWPVPDAAERNAIVHLHSWIKL